MRYVLIKIFVNNDDKQQNNNKSKPSRKILFILT